MEIVHLINNTYQVVDNKEKTTLFQGIKDECIKYIMDRLLNSMSEPELDVLVKIFN